MKKYTYLWLILLFLPGTLFAWEWVDIWQTKDQQGRTLLQAGKADQAATTFVNKDWQAVSQYRAQNYAEAYEYFKRQPTSDGQYNAGNAAAQLGQYEEALKAYEKALALNPKNKDAMANRDLVKKVMEAQKKQEQQQKQKQKQKQEQKQKQQQEQNQQPQQAQDKKQNQAEKNKPSTSQQKPQEQNDEQQKSSTTAQNKPSNKNEMQQKSSTDSASNQNESSAQPYAKNKPSTEQKSVEKLPFKPSQAKEDPKNKLLRAVPDDPGGLLKQKFLRDYMHRHHNGMVEGET